jgi:IS30 family transposase
MIVTIVETRAQTRAITGGVDTHAEVHVAAALDPVGGLLGVAEFPASPAGYAQLLGWLGGFGAVCLVGIEGTGSYGAGLTRHITAAGVRVVEVDRADRQDRRRQGKSDPLDAGRARRPPNGVGVSLSCGSLWFIDAGRVSFIETPISPRYLTQDDRIEIADGLACGEPVKQIAARIGKSYQSVYKEIARNRKPDGGYQPWYAHNQAYVRRRRPKPRRLSVDAGLREVVAGKLAKHWSPAQISRWLRRRYRRRAGWHVCTETIYEAVYRGLVVPVNAQSLRTGRTYRHRRGRGRTRDGALKQSTAMKSIHQRPAAACSRRQAGHWEGDLIVGAAQRSAIATLVERKFRLTVLVPVSRDHSAQTVGDALIGAFTQLPAGLRRTLTWDQGNEMFHHQRIEQQTGLKIKAVKLALLGWWQGA